MAKIITDPPTAGGFTAQYGYATFSGSTNLNTQDSIYEDVSVNNLRESKNMTLSSNRLNVTEDGVFKIDVEITALSGTTSDDYEFRIVKFSGGTQIGETTIHRFANSNSEKGISIDAIASLVNTDAIGIQVRNTTNDSSITIKKSSLVIIRID